VGGKEQTGSPAWAAGSTRRGATKCRTRRSRVAARRDGTRGSDAHPPWPRPAGKRRRARAASADLSAQRSGAEGAHQSSTLESGRPSRRRARATVRQPPPCLPAGSSAPRGNRKHCEPWRRRRRAPVYAHLVPAFRFLRPWPLTCGRNRNPNGPRRRSTTRGRDARP